MGKAMLPTTINNHENLLEQVRTVFQTADLRESTIKQYMYAIKPFLAFVEKRSMGANTLLEYKRQLAGQPLSISAKNSYLSAAIVFMRQLSRSKGTPDWSEVGLFKQGKEHKKPGLDSIEIKKIVGYMSKLKPSPATARFKAIFCLKYYQGLRDIEIYRLDVEDLNLLQATARVQRKGQDDKEVIALFPNTIKALGNYLKAAEIEGGALFISFDNSCYGKRLSERSIYETMAAAFRACRIGEKSVPQARRYAKSPHGFRHTYATKLLDIFGGDVRKVAQFTGHKDIRTVLRYDDGRLHQADVEKAIEGFAKL